jgi:cyclohexanecarboxylate-CoA ligase/acyl-CoA synthetase
VAATASLGVGDRYTPAEVQRFYDKGWWSRRHLTSYLDQWAAEDPAAPFMSDGVRSVTYGAFRDEAYQLARSMRRLGVRHGQRIVVQLPNWVEFATAYVAASRIGAVVVPIMPVYRFEEAEYVINHAEAVLAITTGTFRKFDHLEMFRDLRKSCPTLGDVIVVRGDAGTDELRFDDLVARMGGTNADDELGPVPDPDDVHLIVYTSGTESKPKGCCHTWNTFGFSARGLANDIFRMTRDDNVFMPSPVAHSTGLLVGVAVPLVAGSKAHLLDIWDPPTALARIEEHQCTISASATPFVRMALDAYDPNTSDMSSMRVWLCAGAPIPSTLVAEVMAAFPACHLLPLYGCSEVLAATSCNLDDPEPAVVNSDGRPALDGVEITLADAEGNPVDEGQSGEILYRGPGSMLGYWHDADRTANAIDQRGWYHTSDLGRVFGDGYVRVTGRLKDLVIRGGANISAREVEEHLDTHPKILASAIVGYPDERLGEKACAFIVPADASDVPNLNDIAAYLRDIRRIAVHKIPERLEIVDALPTGATGKIQKFELRKRLDLTPEGARLNIATTSRASAVSG